MEKHVFYELLHAENYGDLNDSYRLNYILNHAFQNYTTYWGKNIASAISPDKEVGK